MRRFDPEDSHRDRPEGAVAVSALVVAGGEAAELLAAVDEALNGLITSDKFCVTRRAALRLTWWRRPLRLR